MSTLEQKVEKLLEKAAAADDAGDALKFTQAALNAAHTKHALADLVHPKE